MIESHPILLKFGMQWHSKVLNPKIASTFWPELFNTKKDLFFWGGGGQKVTENKSCPNSIKFGWYPGVFEGARFRNCIHFQGLYAPLKPLKGP